MALQWMRERFKHLKWVLWVVIAAFVVFFGSDFTGLGSGDPNRTAAWIGDEEIATEEVRSRYRSLESYWRQVFGDRFNADMAKQMNLAGQALQDVVRQRIMLREAQALGLTATDREVRDAILDVEWLRDENGNFVGSEEYDQRLRSYLRMKPEIFEGKVRDDLLMQKLEAILAETVYISDQELEQRYREQAEKAKIRYLLMPTSQFASLEVSREELQRYLDEHLDAFQLPEQRRVSYILVDTIKLRQDLEIPEAELSAYYDDHIAEYTTEEQVLARHILLEITDQRDEATAMSELGAVRQRIAGGADFGELARELSEEPDSAGRGGSLGWFGRGSWGADFTELVFGAERGTTLGPVKTQYGVHLIEIQDQRPGGAPPLEQVSPQIRNRLVAARANELAESRAQDIAARMTEDTMTEEQFLAFADGEGLELQEVEPFGARDMVPGIGRGPFVETAFELKQGGVSAPIKLPRGWAIIRLAGILPPRTPTLEDVENRVRPAALAEKQREQAKERMAGAYGRLSASEITFDELATELSLEAQESAEFGKGAEVPGLGRLPELVAQALASEAGDFGGPYAVPQGAVVYEVSERKHFAADTFAEERDGFLSTESTARLNQMRAAMIARRMRDLEVKFNPQVLELLGVDESRLQG